MKLVRPLHYEIVFEPDLKKFKFHGKEKIEIDVKKQTDRVVLNALDLKINSCSLQQAGKILKPKVFLDNAKQELVLNLPAKIKGRASLLLSFEGILNDKLVGFYRSKYFVGKKEKYLATTQFEAVDARRAFPCWDNPEDKATFDISVIVDKNLQAISNMPVQTVQNIGQKKIVKFERTPLMSTYLVYIGVGEFEFLEDRLNSIQLRVVTTPGKKEHGKLALKFAKQFLKFYQDYFQIQYPLPKLDLIAIPDFAAGAMENWGAITFREAELLFDEKTSSTATKQRIAEIISHELVHQWFGNLVTMRWWNDLWLNESFATFMAVKAIHYFYPEWDFYSQFLNETTVEALETDALKASHPIETEVRKPSEIGEIFDEISYNKGGSILRMLESYLGEETFRKSLKHYLLKHKYGNATTENLWATLEKVSKLPIKKIMSGWTKQNGYPVVEVKTENSKLILSQKRFLYEQKKADKSKWSIPISIKTEKKNISYLLSKKRSTIHLGNSNWFKVNANQSGFFVVDYPSQALDKLKDLVRQKKLSNIDRWGIQNDVFQLMIAGKKTLREYMNFVEAYSNEDDYLVAADIAEKLYFIYLITSRENFWPEIKEFNKAFLSRVFDRLGWQPKKNEKHTDALLRAQTIVYLGRVDSENVLEKSREMFQKFLKQPESLHPDLRSAVYNCVAWLGGRNTYKHLLKLYKQAQTHEEKRRLLIALAGFKEKNFLEKTLNFTLSAEVRSQDMFIPIVHVADNPYGQDIIWPWVKENWKELKNRLGESKTLLRRVVSSMELLSDFRVANDMKKFFEKNPTPGTEMAVAQTLENIRINARFLERIRKSF
jgi:tricorn protease interacting factor F2/3